ncbi:DUF123 domain-containing protein [Halorubrum luteum]
MSSDPATGRGIERSNASDDGVVGGTYSLIVDLPTETPIAVGALGERSFPAGGYVYTGSALGTGGFSRVDRHRRIARGEHDVRHWHVDYLLGVPDTRIVGVVRSEGVDIECGVAERLPDGPVEGFGASDCDCRTHLARADEVASLSGRVEAVHDAVVADAEFR